MKKYFIIFFILFSKNNSNNQIKLYKKQLKFCDQLGDPKAIDACRCNILKLITQQRNIKKNKIKKNKENIKEKNKTVEIANNFSNIVDSFAKMNVNSPASISQSICNVVINIINIVIAMNK